MGVHVNEFAALKSHETFLAHFSSRSVGRPYRLLPTSGSQRSKDNVRCEGDETKDGGEASVSQNIG